MRRICLALAVSVLAPTLAAAQDTLEVRERPSAPARFMVTPYVGLDIHDRSSALRRSSGTAALDVLYRIDRIFSLGVSGSVGRPRTDGTYFPLVRINAGDTSLYNRVSQRMTQYTYGIQGQATLRIRGASPYVSAGLGRYTFTLDPQAVGTTERYSGPLFSIGTGINVPVGSRSGISIDLRDVILSSFERDRLDATDPFLRDARFDAVAAGKPDARSLVHTLRLSIGVSFVPESRETAK